MCVVLESLERIARQFRDRLQIVLEPFEFLVVKNVRVGGNGGGSFGSTGFRWTGFEPFYKVWAFLWTTIWADRI